MKNFLAFFLLAPLLAFADGKKASDLPVWPGSVPDAQQLLVLSGDTYYTVTAGQIRTNLVQSPGVVSGPLRLFILGDSKSVIDPSGGISNQWPRYFTNLPFWSSRIAYFTNFSTTAFTIIDITNSYRQAVPLFAPPASGTNNLIIIRTGANDFPTNSSVPFWVNIYSNMLADIAGRTNCYSCVWDIQPRTDWPDTKVFNRDAMNQALRRLTNWSYFAKAENLVPDAGRTDLFADGIHANTNGAVAESLLCDRSIRFGPQHFYDEPKSFYERSGIVAGVIDVKSISAFSFNTTYQNTNGYPIVVRCNYQLASAAVSGNCGFSGYVNGTASASRGFNTATGIPANSAIYGDVVLTVPAFGNYAFTNSSAGTGNTVTLFGGQITVF